MTLDLQQLEQNTDLDIPGFKTHEGVQALAIRLMMTTAGKVSGGWTRLTQKEADRAGEVPGNCKKSYIFDGTGQGELITVRPCGKDEQGDLLWTDAIIAVEKALAWGLLPSQIWAYYIQAKLVVTLSYKVLTAWASIKSPYNVYHFKMSHQERQDNHSPNGTDDPKDIKVWAYLVDKTQVEALGKLAVEFMDRNMSVEEARKEACRIIAFAEGSGVLRGFEVAVMKDNSFTPIRKAKKRAVVDAITRSLGEPTFFEIRNMQSAHEQQAVAAIAAGEVVNIPESIPAQFDEQYITGEVSSRQVRNDGHDKIDGVTLMRGPIDEEYID